MMREAPVLDKSLERAVRRVAARQQVPIAEVVRRSVRLYVEDASVAEETALILASPKIMADLRAGREARRRRDKRFYTPWSPRRAA